MIWSYGNTPHGYVGGREHRCGTFGADEVRRGHGRRSRGEGCGAPAWSCMPPHGVLLRGMQLYQSRLIFFSVFSAINKPALLILHFATVFIMRFGNDQLFELYASLVRFQQGGLKWEDSKGWRQGFEFASWFIILTSSDLDAERTWGSSRVVSSCSRCGPWVLLSLGVPEAAHWHE